ncbi:hypothetical protein A355_064 [Candidatus Carsonella ruddii HT isolate Thao2000]|uniref:Uncharacterized protein n=1 Tax=Candidatus Carsonella ruddii HT isolate Thao2000 TaxID=1202539 RepID=J3YQA7_CARRU|nr:hypothetical protein [Candidatus Carsonella ruddii]AFP84103.1 hypothetical protein A355_064 [Candidatus Carsonella ruddii HT isolate Thao2000]
MYFLKRYKKENFDIFIKRFKKIIIKKNKILKKEKNKIIKKII